MALFDLMEIRRTSATSYNKIILSANCGLARFYMIAGFSLGMRVPQRYALIRQGILFHGALLRLAVILILLLFSITPKKLFGKREFLFYEPSLNFF